MLDRVFEGFEWRPFPVIVVIDLKDQSGFRPDSGITIMFPQFHRAPPVQDITDNLKDCK
jgi:hypothetical protein